jgi:hypothetical protein
MTLTPASPEIVSEKAEPSTFSMFSISRSRAMIVPLKR